MSSRIYAIIPKYIFFLQNLNYVPWQEISGEKLCIFPIPFRYGKPGCNAETCDYFLSYRRIGADVEFELSADTDGWVAVGFSSDKKMVRYVQFFMLAMYTFSYARIKLVYTRLYICLVRNRAYKVKLAC